MSILIHISPSLLINQFLTLVIIFDSKRGEHSLLIHYMGFFIPFFTIIKVGAVKIIFLSWKIISTPQVIMLNRIGVFSLELLEKANESLL